MHFCLTLFGVITAVSLSVAGKSMNIFEKSYMKVVFCEQNTRSLAEVKNSYWDKASVLSHRSRRHQEDQRECWVQEAAAVNFPLSAHGAASCLRSEAFCQQQPFTSTGCISSHELLCVCLGSSRASARTHTHTLRLKKNLGYVYRATWSRLLLVTPILAAVPKQSPLVDK